MIYIHLNERGLIFMLGYLKDSGNITYTANGACTYLSSESECLDLFYRIGALRNGVSDREIEKLAERAYAENPLKAMKIFFFARDIRGGLGERRVFRIIMKYMAEYHSESVRKNLGLFSEYGRWDDLVMLYGANSLNNDIISVIKKQLIKDIEDMKSDRHISLLAKWLPSINTSSEKTRIIARKICAELGYSEKNYRKTLSSLRRYIDIIENRLREKDYTFSYEKQPSRALFFYRNAFIKNDNKRYMNYLESVNKGKAKMNTSALYPYDIIREALKPNLSYKDIKSLDACWNSMKSIPQNENAIAVIDGSGSMYCGVGSPKPYEAALALGLYFAEKSHGKFANHFITFSSRPQLIEMKGSNICEKARYVASFNEVADTDIQAVFDLILNTAVRNKLSQSELPSRVYIISDMEFNSCVYLDSHKCTNFETAKYKYNKYGYKLPDIIFWNVNSYNQQVPVKMHESGAALVSGSSPAIFDMVKSGEINPVKIMNDIIESERYLPVSA